MKGQIVNLRNVVGVALGFLVVMSVFTIMLHVGMSVALGSEEAQAGRTHPDVVKWGFLAAAVAVGLGSIGAGIAVSSVGSAAMGAMAEKPEMAARALIFVGLAEGIAIYGLIIAIMILGKL
ncbi:H+transporting two-sector ATPase C subunit [candidate division KSB3 bacterium]|uniref:H+transporting two-sector ATPase C subunit n=1 Tax=candidate division KSB3 bacterium TaxID=2044937 RepID=A0A2G6E9K5_9BACT|nr:MAG: H+transporting two-sector ATPase C subunit [candidate division KSB3 bacterium]PIE29585.1 MAG: H+transporting two-sector ATPase C subunit [candidate division KSB3 bacterium]